VAAAHTQTQQRVVEHGPAMFVPGGEPLLGVNVSQLVVLIAADVAQVRVVSFGYLQAEMLAEQGEQLRGTVILDQCLERVAPGDGELRLAERDGITRVGRQLLLVGTGCVHQGSPRAARIRRQGGDRARVVPTGQ
jgi:hypothetical protein